MKKHSFFFLVTSFTILTTYAQKVKTSDVPDVVKSALQTKYPGATHVYWEKEHGNYEANCGGKSHEDHSAQFTASGNFLEYVEAIPVTELPKEVEAYIKTHYKGAKITEAGKVTDAHGKLFYEAEVHKKDIMFDEHGKFVKEEG